MTQLITLAQIKSEAELLKKNQNLTHTQALDYIAKKLGFRTFQILQGLAKKCNDYIFYDKENHKINMVLHKSKVIECVCKYGYYKLSNEYVIDSSGITKINKDGTPYFNENINKIRIEDLVKTYNFTCLLKHAKNFTTRCSSYTIKHAAERFLRETSYKNNKSDAYVGNGVLIIAMILCNFEFKPINKESINAYFKFSYQSLKDIDYALDIAEILRKEILFHNLEFAFELPIYKKFIRIDPGIRKILEDFIINE